MQNNLKKRSTSFGLHHVSQNQYNQQNGAENPMPQRYSEIDVTKQYAGHLSPTDFITPRNNQFQVGVPNLAIGQSGLTNLISPNNIGNYRQNKTQLPQL